MLDAVVVVTRGEKWGKVWWQEMRGEGGCSGGEKEVLVGREGCGGNL